VRRDLLERAGSNPALQHPVGDAVPVGVGSREQPVLFRGESHELFHALPLRSRWGSVPNAKEKVRHLRFLRHRATVTVAV
jgi:hypothetical protein